VLFDPGCNADGNMNTASFAVPRQVAAGSTPGNHHWRRTGTACRLGRLVITSGLNAIFQRSIRNWDGASTLQFLNPLPIPSRLTRVVG
jgi:hypothetical protein